jgi:hypothetical protein
VCCVITCTNGGSQPFSSLYSPPATRHILLICTLHPAPCTLLYSTLYTALMHPAHCYPAPCTLHTATLHPAPSTLLYSTLYTATLNPTSYTLLICTLHPSHCYPAPCTLLYSTLYNALMQPAHCYPASFIHTHYYSAPTHT